MIKRAPTTLWIYLLIDLWKLILLTTAVLVTVTAFALAVKPLADGKLGPEDALKYMLLGMVPMLQYVLPFAACFGATLAYHRFASDNEMTAASAGGVSHRAILVPGLITGLILAVVVLVLANSVMPRFLKKMAELVTMDAAKFIESSIKRGEALRIPGNDGTMIYADSVQRLGPDPRSGSFERMWLGGLLVVQLDAEGKVRSQGSAREAAVWLRRTNAGGPEGRGSTRASTEIIVKPKDASGFGPGFRGANSESLFTLQVPNSFSDNIKFLSIGEMNGLYKNPQRIDSIDRHRVTMAMVLAERRSLDGIAESLRATGTARFKDPFGQEVVLRAADIRPTFIQSTDPAAKRERDPRTYRVVPARKGESIVIERQLEGGRVQRQTAADAYIRFPSTPDIDRGTATLTLQLLRVAAVPIGSDGEVEAPVADPAAPTPTGFGEVEQRPLADLAFIGDQSKDLLAMPTGDLLARADERLRDIKPIDRQVLDEPMKSLREGIDELFREILSKQHERFAHSSACLIMVLIGSVMALRLRDALPLTVYLWAFFPALVCTLAISGGQQMTHGQGAWGLPLLWGGVAALSAFVLFEYARLIRH
ncbi:MAG: LptF/LptG family permease [Phycisphaerales bacterium]|nr:LptF/LptG family permease [Phycisphaerales bacterium]